MSLSAGFSGKCLGKCYSFMQAFRLITTKPTTVNLTKFRKTV